MSSIKNEINTYFGRCRCCLNYDYLKNMWEEYYWKGKKEIYVEMLVQCFALSWDQSDVASSHDQICEPCIKRLRDAHIFKKTILESQVYLLDNIEENKLEAVNNIDDNFIYVGETEADDSQYEDPDEAGFKQHDFEYKTGNENPDALDDEIPDASVDTDDTKEMDYEGIEYLEEEDIEEHVSERENLQKEIKSESLNNTKSQRKLPKICTEEELEACVEDVRNQKLTLTEASEKYNISKTTIINKFNQDAKEDQKKFELKNEKRIDFKKEVKLIFTYTNATPFKSQANKYCCCYCPSGSPCFDNADHLRTHVTTEHSNERIKKLDQVLPCRITEILKLDIHELECVKCTEPISDWNNMLAHLTDIHAIELKYAYTKIVPYDLTDLLKCAFCEQKFGYYMHLDSHMNTHYNNYVCAKCGDTFVAETRWRRHLRSHNMERYACRFCRKVFTSFLLKNKHEEIIHDQLPKFKCQYCDDRFSSEYLRHMHMIEDHNEKVNIMTCEYCGKTFTWKPYYRKHKRLHTDGKRFECNECGKKYSTQMELKNHILRHVGQKPFSCGICKKQYVSSSCLKNHMYRHNFT